MSNVEGWKERKIILKTEISEKEKLVNDGCFKKAEIHQLNQDFYAKIAELSRMLLFPT